jgi:MFS transporter, DHA1 family, multidrug resistance protein
MEKQKLKHSLYASLMLAFAGIGDSFLYPFLPLNYEAVGITVGAVGLLLSINRFVRLFTNHLIVDLFGSFGFRRVSIIATFLAIVTTAAYGFVSNFILWIIIRIVWGLCFSVLRLSSMTYSMESKQKGLSLGLNGSIYEIASFIALFIGPLLLTFLNIPLTFLGLAAISSCGLYFAFRLVDIKQTKDKGRSIFLSIPSIFNTLIFISSLVLEGILVIMISVMIKEEHLNLSTPAILALAAVYLNFRRICKMICAPIAGWICDRIGFEKVFVLSLFISCIGLFILSFYSICIGLIIVFAFNGINSSVVPGNAAQNSENKVQAISETSTWRDFGAAIGALFGGLLLTFENVASLFWIPSLLMLVLLYFYQLKADSQLKQRLKWK